MSDARSRPAGWWWVVALAIVVGVAAGFVVGRQASSSVVSTSTVLVQGVLTDGENQADAALTSNQYVTARMLTYPSIVTSDRVTGPATQQLGLPAGELNGTITAAALPESTSMSISVTGTTPAEAQRRNEAVTSAVVDQITELETGAPPAPQRVALTVLSPASVPETSFLDGPIGAVLGAVFGGLVGVALAVSLAGSHRGKQRRRQAYDDPIPARADLPPRAAGGPPRRAAQPPPPAPRIPDTNGSPGRRAESGRERQ